MWLAAMLVQAAAPSWAPDDPNRITEPDWDKRPPPAVASRYYPKALAQEGGGASLEAVCIAGPDGMLNDCRIVEDSRPGLGGGEALLQILGLYRLKPVDRSGRPVAGRPLHFRMRMHPPIVFARAEGGWEILQDPYAWDDAYPKAALAAGVSGDATVACRGKKGARRIYCTVEAEAPEVQGFGAAALELQKRILVKPPRAGAGTDLRMTLSFRAPPAP